MKRILHVMQQYLNFQKYIIRVLKIVLFDISARSYFRRTQHTYPSLYQFSDRYVIILKDHVLNGTKKRIKY